jgi:hypothetical protein
LARPVARCRNPALALRQYWPDYAALRRYLFDEGFVTRSVDGLRYRRT